MFMIMNIPALLLSAKIEIVDGSGTAADGRRGRESQIEREREREGERGDEEAGE